MPRFQYHEDPRTGDRMVTITGPALFETGPLCGQCECGSSIALPRNGDAVECNGCGAIFRLVRNK